MKRVAAYQLALALVIVATVGWLEHPESAQGDTDADIPEIVYFAGIVPGTPSYGLEIVFSCVARPYGLANSDDWLFYTFCYTGEQPPTEFVPNGDTRFGLVRQQGLAYLVAPLEADGAVTLPVLDCLILQPRLDIAFTLDLKNLGDSEIRVTEDPVGSGDCTGDELPSSTAPLLVSTHDRTADLDGDGCVDYYELSLRIDFFGGLYESPDRPGLQLSDNPYGVKDPFNPSDCTQEIFNAPGTYYLWGTPESSAKGAPGVQYYCIANLTWTSDIDIVARPYCYVDSTSWEVNPEAHPGEFGDGMLWSPPPGDLGTDRKVFGDVDSAHSTLSGSYEAESKSIALSGCIADLDGRDSFGNVYVEWRLDTRSGQGAMTHWNQQEEAACDTGLPAGPPTYLNRPLSIMWGGVGPASEAFDFDGDSCPDAKELTSARPRDPFNKYDYYDVNGDGVIDLAGDIVGVLLHHAPEGYSEEPHDHPPIGPGPEDDFYADYDRSPAKAGSNPWNLGAPDGVIDYANDFLAVIQQFSPDGC